MARAILREFWRAEPHFARSRVSVMIDSATCRRAHKRRCRHHGASTDSLPLACSAPRLGKCSMAVVALPSSWKVETGGAKHTKCAEMKKAVFASNGTQDDGSSSVHKQRVEWIERKESSTQENKLGTTGNWTRVDDNLVVPHECS